MLSKIQLHVLYCFCRAGNLIQDLAHVKLVLYHWTASLAKLINRQEPEDLLACNDLHRPTRLKESRVCRMPFFFFFTKVMVIETGTGICLACELQPTLTASSLLSVPQFHVHLSRWMAILDCRLPHTAWRQLSSNHASRPHSWTRQFLIMPLSGFAKSNWTLTDKSRAREIHSTHTDWRVAKKIYLD